MSWKITFACLLAANLTLGACAPLIIVGTAAAAGGLTASELRTIETGKKEASTTTAMPPAETSANAAAPLETVESWTLE